MVEKSLEPHSARPLLKELGIGHVGTLVLLGQGPVQDAYSKVKLEKIAGGEAEANTWMRMIARAGAELYKSGGVDAIIPSGKATGGTGPTEAELMEIIVRNLTRGEKVPPKIIKEPEARNTLYNFINTANIIDERGLGKDVTIVCAHFHLPRIKLLASLFGFNPDRVVSAESILNAATRQKLGLSRGKEFNSAGFDRQVSMLELLQIRLGDNHEYFDRKKARAKRNLQNFGVEPDLVDRFFIEEQKSAADRMLDERRWVRGIATEPDYVVPLLGQIKNDSRLNKALSHFSDEVLKKYDIDRSMPAQDIRAKLEPTKWSWQVVKEAWHDDPYPKEVLDRLQELGLSREDSYRLSQAHVPEIQLTGSSQ